MAPDGEGVAWTPAEMTRALRRMEGKLDRLTEGLPSTYVPLKLWEQRNRQVDDVHSRLGREIGDLRLELRSKRLPWTAVLTAIAAAVALGLTLVQALG